MKILKEVYGAPGKEQAERGLAILGEQWGKQYPMMVKAGLTTGSD